MDVRQRAALNEKIKEGRTSNGPLLCKWLWMSLSQSALFPLYVQGGDVFGNIKQCKRVIEKLFLLRRKLRYWLIITSPEIMLSNHRPWTVATKMLQIQLLKWMQRWEFVLHSSMKLVLQIKGTNIDETILSSVHISNKFKDTITLSWFDLCTWAYDL